MVAFEKRDEVWACNFMTDALTDGRQARVVAVLDEYSRECLAAKAAVSYPSTRVCRVLNVIAEARGRYTACVRTDNGPEFLANDFARWCARHSVHHHRIAFGRPMDNGPMERLNRTLREDVLDFWTFDSLRTLNDGMMAWRERYNASHPHSALGGVAPRNNDAASVLVAGSPSGSPTTKTP